MVSTRELRAVSRERIAAPEHLREATREWFEAVLRDYDLEPHHVRLLTLAGEAWDRAQEARETIVEAGAYFTDRWGAPKAHPAVAVERDSRIAFARLLRELDLGAEPAPDVRVPRRGRR